MMLARIRAGMSPFDEADSVECGLGLLGHACTLKCLGESLITHAAMLGVFPLVDGGGIEVTMEKESPTM